MAQTFNGRIDLKVTGSYSSDIDLGNRSYSLSKTYTNSFANGQSANQAEAIFTDTRSTSGNDDLDLAGGIVDAFGAALTFVNVKTIIIQNHSDSTGNAVIGAEGTNEFDTFFGDASDTISVPPGGMFCLTNPGADGFGVVASTGDKLRIAASAGTINYDVIIIGEV